MSQGKKLGIKPFIIMNAIAAALIALAAIVGSALAFTLWDVPLTNFIGSTEPGRTNASSRLDLEYYKSGLKYGDTLSDAERALSEEIALYDCETEYARSRMEQKLGVITVEEFLEKILVN